MSVLFNSSKNSAKAEISNHEADPLSCEHCPAGRFFREGICDRFQEAGRCTRAALVSALDDGRVQIVVSGEGLTLSGDNNG